MPTRMQQNWLRYNRECKNAPSKENFCLGNEKQVDKAAFGDNGNPVMVKSSYEVVGLVANREEDLTVGYEMKHWPTLCVQVALAREWIDEVRINVSKGILR